MGDKSVEPRVTVGLGVRALGMGALAELLEEGSNRELAQHGDTHLHIMVELSVCLQNIPARLLCFLGWLCEDCCVLSLVVSWEDLNHFSVLFGISRRDCFSLLPFTCRIEVMEQVMGNYGLCDAANLNFPKS